MKATFLRTLYNKVVNGLPVLGTPADVARRYENKDGTPDADGLIAYYMRLGGAAGFVGGVPGFLLLPLTLPANMLGVAAIQLHMSAALAVLAGQDPRDPATRDRCIGCLLDKIGEDRKNSEEEEVVNRAGIKLLERGVRFAVAQAVKLVGRAARRAVLRRVGGRGLPLVGGALGAGSDAYVTRHVGRCAKAAFLTA